MPADPTLSTFSDVRVALKGLIASVAPPSPSAVPYQVEWENQARSFTDPNNQARILLSVKGMQGIGKDEDRSTFDGTAPLGHEITITKSGLRKFQFRVKVESYDFAEPHTADSILSYMYTRLQWDSTDLVLTSVNCAYADDSPMAMLDYEQDGNWVSCAMVDFTICWGTNDTDVNNPIGYIAEVVIDGQTLKNPDGSAHVPQPHIDVTAP